MELHREEDRSSRTSEGLLARMQNIVDSDEEKRQRSQQEDAFSKQLGQNQQRGQLGKAEQREPSRPKDAAVTDATEKLRSQLSAKDRQLSALSGQLKQASRACAEHWTQTLTISQQREG